MQTQMRKRSTSKSCYAAVLDTRHNPSPVLTRSALVLSMTRLIHSATFSRLCTCLRVSDIPGLHPRTHVQIHMIPVWHGKSEMFNAHRAQRRHNTQLHTSPCIHLHAFILEHSSSCIHLHAFIFMHSSSSNHTTSHPRARGLHFCSLFSRAQATSGLHHPR